MLLLNRNHPVDLPLKNISTFLYRILCGVLLKTGLEHYSIAIMVCGLVLGNWKTDKSVTQTFVGTKFTSTLNVFMEATWDSGDFNTQKNTILNRLENICSGTERKINIFL